MFAVVNAAEKVGSDVIFASAVTRGELPGFEFAVCIFVDKLCAAA